MLELCCSLCQLLQPLSTSPRTQRHWTCLREGAKEVAQYNLAEGRGTCASPGDSACEQASFSL